MGRREGGTGRRGRWGGVDRWNLFFFWGGGVEKGFCGDFEGGGDEGF